jgi:16S rRNA (cytidine1402-2'-O)-methyltransferase
MLYIISLPIGNSKDITLRAIEVLEEVEILLCEDSRVTRKLLEILKIKNRPKLFSFYDQVEREKTGQVLEFLREGRKVGLVSDAGTPLLSDPGWWLVKEAINKGLEVEVVGGISAALVALELSGLAADKFCFLGFLPRKGSKRKRIFEIYKGEVGTKIIYESALRMEKTLGDILENWGDRKMAICREMTKKHEEITRGMTSEVLTKIKGKKLKGEVVLVVG